MNDHITRIRAQVRQPGDVPTRLAAAFTGIALVEHAVHELAQRAEPDLYPAYATAQHQAVECRGALSRAPSLPWPATPPSPIRVTADDEAAIAMELAELADALTHALVEAAKAATVPDDTVACLTASLHASHLHEALR